METQKQQSKTQGFIADVKVYKNQDAGTLTHVFGESCRIEYSINLYKKILGIDFEKVERMPAETERKITYGLRMRPSVFLSKDGKYLIHAFLGLRISKPVNYYKRILEEQDLETQSA